MFGIDPVKMAKEEGAKLLAKIEALDLDHNGKKDVDEAKALLAEAQADCAFLEEKLKDAEVVAKLDAIFAEALGAGSAAKILGAVPKVEKALAVLQAVAAAAGGLL